ncbi:MAG: hypothetical protein EBT79_02480 [Actinobacteria bacterium]|nr:hypothetical protein [Actinomycetota bacterium]NBR66142.1 hypothetical protein [Actinomycetota bacterium]
MGDTNIFGGGNARSLYTPMSEVEQEVIARLVEAGDLRVVIVGWGHVDRPRVTFGDLRLSVVFRLTFDRPETPIPVHYLDLELRTGSGVLLFRDRQPTTYGGNPILVAQGVFIDLAWDIAIKSIDPALVKTVLPGVTGLTSRLQDKDTGRMTLTGNMKLKAGEAAILRQLREGEAAAKANTAERLRRKK